MALIDPKFWQGKRVFLTGHTGFKGGWLSLWLQDLGAVTKGYALPPPTQPSLFEVANIESGIDSEFGDIRNLENLKNSMVQFQPEILIHMAAQSLVRPSYVDPVSTYSVNVMGTVNVLESAKNCLSLRAIIVVTSDPRGRLRFPFSIDTLP